MTDLTTLRTLATAATPGPWYPLADFGIDGPNGAGTVAYTDRYEGGFVHRADRDLVLAMRNALPALLDRLEKAEELAEKRYRNYLDVADAICRESAGPADLVRQAQELRVKLVFAKGVVEAARRYLELPMEYRRASVVDALSAFDATTGEKP